MSKGSGLLSISKNIFVLIRQFEQCRDEFGYRFYDLCLIAIKAFKNNGLKIGLSEESMSNSVYALVALIDEVVLKSSWEVRSRWCQKTLQMHFFKTHVAGEGFYSRFSAS